MGVNKRQTAGQALSDVRMTGKQSLKMTKERRGGDHSSGLARGVAMNLHPCWAANNPPPLSPSHTHPGWN